MKKYTFNFLAFLMLILLGNTLKLEAQVYADQITVTAQGTDGRTTCCGLLPLRDGLSSSKRITSKALGVPQASDASTPSASYNFYSLGFGGEVVVRMGNGFNNIAGIDLQIHETSFGVTAACTGVNPDRVRVWVSQDNCNFILLGDFCEQGPNPIQISLPSYLPWARFVKLRGITINPNSAASATQDGFDFDGLKGLSARTSAPASGSSIHATSVISFLQGLTLSGGSVTASNSNSTQALGIPQNNEVAGALINFVSLGFGGSITLEMDRLVFKRSTGNEIQILETSTGSPSCAASPERAVIDFSLNGTTWVNLSSICNDGILSIPSSASFLASSGQYAIRYLRITDISSTTSPAFSSTSNGYDVDGVIGFACSTAAKLAEDLEEIESEEILQVENEEMITFPNPTNGLFTVIINSIHDDGVIRVFNSAGALVKENKLMSKEENVQVSIENFATGLYLIIYQDGKRQFVNRIVKN